MPTMTTAARPQPCNSLWIGHGLGPLERTCLASFVEIGHPVRLYAYEDLSGVPPGVEVRDARAVLPHAAVARHLATGHFSLVANRFRYLLQRADLGLWIDCDLLCLRPIPDAPFVFGRQDERRINNAVLRIPHDEPILSDLLASFESPNWIPPWEPLRRRIRYAIRRRLQPGFGVADMPWGTTGPNALTYHLARHGLTDRALPRDAFYPVSLREAGALLTPDHAAVRASVTDRTLCIHLWNKALSEQTGPPPRGSFLEAVIEGSWRDYLLAGGAAVSAPGIPLDRRRAGIGAGPRPRVSVGGPAV